MTSALIGLDGDLRLERGDLVLDESVVSAVLVSLLCDAPAPDVAPESQRGYWGDRAGVPIGSRLWELDRAKATVETAARARDYAESALRWLVDEGIAESVDVAAEIVRQGVLVFEVTLVRGSARRWSHLWDAFADFEGEYDGGLIRVRGV